MKNICVSRPDDASVFVRFFPFQPDADLLLPVAVGHLLRIEAVQKLKLFHPVSIGQASRISGVSPADISVLLVYLEQLRRK